MSKTYNISETSLVLMCGPTSSGKSTFARKHFSNTQIVSSDQYRLAIMDSFTDSYYDNINDVWEIAELVIKARMKNKKLVVVDCTNLRQKDRNDWRKLAKEYYYNIHIIVMDTDIEERVERSKNKSFHVTKKLHNKHNMLYEAAKRQIPSEKFKSTIFVNEDNYDDVKINIVKPKCYKHNGNGVDRYMIIGDVHGCIDEFRELIDKNPDGRMMISLGDLIDRGPEPITALSLALDLQEQGKMLVVKGNHENKLFKYLKGKNVTIKERGLKNTVEQYNGMPEDEQEKFKRKFMAWWEGAPTHYILDNDKLVVAHGDARECTQGRDGGGVKAINMYSTKHGTDEYGHPMRDDWASEYKGRRTVVYGHTPNRVVRSINNTHNIDQGCCFGGKLTAMLYPEVEFMHVDAKKVYFYDEGWDKYDKEKDGGHDA